MASRSQTVRSQPSYCQPFETTNVHRALDRVADRKKEFRTKARALATTSELAKAAAVKTPAMKKQDSKQHKELAVAGRVLRLAKRKRNGQIEAQAKRECRGICEAVYQRLPRELRNMVYDELITEKNATFYDGPDNVMLANGCNELQYCFDAEYTGPDMHKDMIEELDHRGARFDFRHHHALLGKAFEHYSGLGFDLAPIISRVGVTINKRDLKTREVMKERLKELYKLKKDSKVFFFIETSGKTKAQIVHSFSSVLRMIFPVLQELEDAGYKVSVVMNPSYVRPDLLNSSWSGFSTIHEQNFRYVMNADNAQFSVRGFDDKLQAYLKHYGNSWGYRVALEVPEGDGGGW
jgi:hypothetical protein